MKTNVLMTFLTTLASRTKTNLTNKNQTLNNRTFSLTETETYSEHRLKGYAAMGVLQLV